MRSEAFKHWLADKLSDNAAASRFSNAARLENFYGDLDGLYAQDGFGEFSQTLQYTSADKRASRPNPSKIPIQGDLYAGLATLRNALSLYKTFRDDTAAISDDSVAEVLAPILQERRLGKQFEVERNLQIALRQEISQLELGLEIVDDGCERIVASGNIDILARDASGSLVVIELKAGLAHRDAIGQLLGYIGDLIEEDPQSPVRGILVAASFHNSCRSACLAVPSVSLREYRFSFTFENPA